MAERFNEAECQAAMKTALADISDVIKKFKETAETVATNLSVSGTALGGAVGAAAAKNFADNSETNFANVQTALNEFTEDRVANIIKSNVATVDAATSTYGN